MTNINLSEIINSSELNNTLLSFQKLLDIRISINELSSNKQKNKENNNELYLKYHLANKDSTIACEQSIKLLIESVKKDKIITKKCKNGLTHIIYPVYYKNKHIANIIAGQFLLEEPDLKYFTNQAKKYKFNIDEYISIIKKITVLNKEKFEILSYLIKNISSQIINNIKVTELNNELNKKNNKLINILKSLKDTNIKIFENIIDTIAVINNEGIVYNVNPAITQQLGYSPDEIIGHNIAEFIPPEYHQVVFGQVQRAFLGEKYIVVETPLYKKNRELMYASVSGVFFNLDNGELVDAIFIRDITSHYNAKHKIIENEKKYRLLFEKSPLGIYVADVKGNIIDANETLIKLLDSPSVVETKKINIIKYKKLINIGYSNLFKKCIKTGVEQNTQVLYKTKWGKDLYLDSFLYPIKDNNGKIIYVYAIIRDITSEKRYETKILKAKEKAEQSDRLKTAFLSNMSHEIRTPLNVIIGFSEVLQEDKDLSENKKNKYLKYINSSSIQLLDLITDILDLSKIQSNQLKFENKEFDVGILLNEIYFIYNQKDNNKNITIEKPIKSIDKIILNVDKSRVNQVLINLLNNAYKFTEQGKIEFGFKLKDKYVEFFVKDTGIGIEKKYLKSIFNRFEQTDEGASAQYQGTGLGLAISKGIIKKLGGKIWCESEKGKGSTFYFTIPKN